MENQSAFETFELNLTEEIQGYLREIAKWAYFLSILGFIGLGLMVFFGLFFGAIMGAVANDAFAMGYSAGMGMIYVVLALIYFFPILYLFKFAKKMKAALNSKNNGELTSAFSNLKSHYKFIGIFTVVILSIYLLIFIVAIIGGAAAAF
ncbi:MAG: hypothetical protein KDD13_05280 [Mangrovimonas sp.]|nr:hypothetical protein [Mangrovimonas sp.]MCB0427030.1 hypothetical protein [Mangrovimonas sp.]MCB0434573.1 hypothetical protein [Mangrovimonas sp.]MCB0469365.1 hypothetical protein [Flavobacteriaceae bacterium]